MKKALPFNVLSDTVRCSEKNCQRLLKARLVESKEPHRITKCFRHYKAARRIGLSKTAALR